MKNINIKLSAVFAIAIMLFGTVVPHAIAEEIVVTGNGAASSNQTTVASTQQTTVTQSNTANVTNNVTVNANTGNNTASNNTGGNTAIATGDVNSSTGVTNNLNTSIASQDCGCIQGTSTSVISGNGAGSNNSINYNSSNKTTVSTLNNGTVINNIRTNANTGGNTTDSNTGGNVTIHTGNIFAKNNVLNYLNFSKVSFSNATPTNSELKIVGNGAFSLNNLNFLSNFNTNITVTNLSSVINDITSALNTGNNHASGNTDGDVMISTGDILSETTVDNYANASIVDVSCGCKKEVPTPPVPPTSVTPPAPSSGGSGGGSSSSSGGSSGNSLAAAIGNMLPSTGINWLLLALMGNIMMLFLGAFLRLRSGRGPGVAYSL